MAYENIFVNFMCKLVLPCILLCKRVVIKPIWAIFNYNLACFKWKWINGPEVAIWLLNLWILVNGTHSAISGHPISMNFPHVDGWSMDPWVLGRHNLVSELRYTTN